MPRQFPPGPRNWNVFCGLTWRHAYLLWSRPLTFVKKLADRYGDIVFYRLFTYRAYQISRPELIREVLVTKGASFEKGDRQMKILREIMGDGLVSSGGELWQRQRSQLKHSFTSRQALAHADATVETTFALLGKWRRDVEISGEMLRLTMQVSARTMFGLLPSDLEGDLGQALTDASDAMFREMAGMFRLPDWLPVRSKRKKLAAMAELNRFVDRAFAWRRAGKTGGQADLLSVLLTAVESGAMSEEQARAEAFTLFIAGYHSSSMALSWTQYLLAKHPQWQQRIAREVEGVAGGRDLVAADLPKLIQTGMVLKESLRLYPAAWSLFVREAIEDVELDGYRIKKGSWVFMYPWVTHRDPNVFAEPERFDPLRFSPERECEISPFAYFPFGRGAHGCLGGNMAMMQMTLILATIVRRYRLALPPNRPEPVPTACMGLRPRGGIHLRLAPREAAVLDSAAALAVHA